MCFDYTKHPEYAKILEIKDKKIQERVLNIHKKNCEKGFDLRKYIQKFQSGQTYALCSVPNYLHMEYSTPFIFIPLEN